MPPKDAVARSFMAALRSGWSPVRSVWRRRRWHYRER
jgi:hypothetical protein